MMWHAYKVRLRQIVDPGIAKQFHQRLSFRSHSYIFVFCSKPVFLAMASFLRSMGKLAASTISSL